jgi:hypothetical protein
MRALLLPTLLCVSCASPPPPEPMQPQPEQTSPTPGPAQVNQAAVAQSLEQASVQGAALQARTIEHAAEIWRTTHPTGCPSTADLVRDHHLMSDSAAIDPWGSSYVITCKGDSFEVRSWGPDKAAGTADDVMNQVSPRSQH